MRQLPVPPASAAASASVFHSCPWCTCPASRAIASSHGPRGGLPSPRIVPRRSFSRSFPLSFPAVCFSAPFWPDPRQQPDLLAAAAAPAAPAERLIRRADTAALAAPAGRAAAVRPEPRPHQREHQGGGQREQDQPGGHAASGPRTGRRRCRRTASRSQWGISARRRCRRSRRRGRVPSFPWSFPLCGDLSGLSGRRSQRARAYARAREYITCIISAGQRACDAGRAA